MSDFQFDRQAIYTLESERRVSIVESIQPANTAPKSRLVTAQARVSSDWYRSLKQLKKLQSARASHVPQFYQPQERRFGSQCPLPGINTSPKPLLFETDETNELREVR